MKGGESFMDKLNRGKNEAVVGANQLTNKTKEITEATYQGWNTLDESRRRHLNRKFDGASGYSSLYSTPIIKHGGKKNRRRKRKTRRRKRKTKRRTKRKRRTSKRRKRRR